MPGRLRLPAAISSGVLLVLIFPLPGLAHLAWFALVPLVLASFKSRPGEAFLLGIAAGTVWNAGSLFWIRNYHPLALFPVVAALSLYTGAFAVSVNRTAMKNPAILPVSVPLAWTSLEYLGSLGPLGFPWNSLGYSMHRNLPLIQAAEYSGVFGISFIIAAVNGALASTVLCANNRKKASVFLLAAPVLPLIFTAFGHNTRAPAKDIPFKVVVIQPNIHPEIRWGEFGHVIAESFLKLLSEAEALEPGLVILPETLIAEDLSEAFRKRTWLYEAFREKAGESGALVLAGAHREERDRLFNSAYLLSPEREILETYDKIKLVPGGEYAPFARDIRAFRKLLRGAGGYTPGSERTIFTADGGKFAVLICFEGIFGDHARRFIDGGAEFLVNITNDAWSMSRTSHFQHASMSVFRSVENRVYTVRAGNTGISKIICPSGEVLESLPYRARGFLAGRVYPREGSATFYTRRGDVFAIAASAAFALLLAVSFRINP